MMTQQQLTHVLAVFSGILIGAGLLVCVGQHSPPAASIPAAAVDPQSGLPRRNSETSGSVVLRPGSENAGNSVSAQALDLRNPRFTASPSGSGSPVHSGEHSSRQEPLKGYDLDGRMIRLGAEHSSRAIALIFLGTECPIARSSIPKLNQLFDDFSPHGVEFYAVFSDPHLTRSELRSHVREFSIRFPALFDITGDLAVRLSNEITPQAFVLSPFGDVLYSGLIDDQIPTLTRRTESTGREHLRQAISAVLAGRHSDIAATDPVGCRVTRSEIEQPAFLRVIAPIIYGNCATCHHDGAVAPFPLTTFDEVRRHAAQIRVMVDLELMPPWKPAAGFGHFADDLRLTARERNLLSRWASQNAPVFGDPADQCPVPELAGEWQLGSPDLVLRVPTTAIPADGPDIYQYSVLSTGLTESRVVAAIEYRSSNPRIVHHASFRYDDQGNARRLAEAFQTEHPGSKPGRYRRFGGWGFWSGGTLGGWALGVLPKRLPDGYGRPISADSDFVLQTHYHPSGNPEPDQAEIGIYFAPASTQRRISELFVASIDLKIPPGERQFRHLASYTLPVKTTLHSVLPHTHRIGRSTTAIATLPDGHIERLNRIEDWDFNWQGQYFYRRPVVLPAGTRIDFEVVFDNSSFNPQNPNSPPATITWGEQTTHEMAVCFFDVSTQTASELDRLLKHNRRYIADQEIALTGRTSGAFGAADSQ